MPAHYHNAMYKISDYSRYPHVVGTTMALIIGATLATATAGVTVGTAVYQVKQEKKQQQKLLDYQSGQVAAAEAKVAGAEALATQTAADKLKKQRLAQTQTILTSPLGISEEATTSMPTLLGGR